MGDAVFCVVGAIVGAGFASGREIMQFFSRWGTFSWPLAALAGALMGFLIYRLLRKEGEKGAGIGFRCLAALVYLAVGGGMTAAAGELWALTVPLHCARAAGSLITLALCACLAAASLKGMAWLGKALLPCMALAFLLCLRVPGQEERGGSVSLPDGAIASALAASYCGMNALLSAPVLAEMGKKMSAYEKKRAALLSGLTTGGLLLLANAALLPHAQRLKDQALPTVALLRDYGKLGYYLSAAVLYLAVMTTLTAVLRGLNGLLSPFAPHFSPWVSALLTEAVSLAGFQDIVEKAYPALGFFSLFFLWKNGTKAVDLTFLGERKQNS